MSTSTMSRALYEKIVAIGTKLGFVEVGAVPWNAVVEYSRQRLRAVSVRQKCSVEVDIVDIACAGEWRIR